MYKFNKNRNQQATNFTNKDQHTTSSVSTISFTSKKNQCETSTKRKTNMQKVSRTKNQHTKSSMNKKSAGNKFHEQNQFHKEKNQCTNFTRGKFKMKQVSWMKISKRQVLWTKSVARGEKLMQMFYEEINEYVTSFMNQQAASSMNEKS